MDVTRLSRFFLAFMVLLAGVFVMVVVDGSTVRRMNNLNLVASVTRLPGASLSVSYFEPRLRHYADYSSTFYPGMRPLNTMNFVYVP